jgi:hypothetical protein
MDENQIKEYIIKYKNSYTKEQINSQLLKSGATEQEIKNIEFKMNNKPNTQIEKTKGEDKSKLGFFLILIGLIIPVLGYILMIWGLVLGIKGRKISKSGFSLFVIIFGILGLIIGFFTHFFIAGALIFSFVDFGSLLPNKVDISTQNIYGDSVNSIALSSENYVYLAFTHTGGQKSIINTETITLTTTSGKECNAIDLSNDIISLSGAVTDINFLNGHKGTITFDCMEDDNGLVTNAVGNLKTKDIIEGEISIGIKNAREDNAIPISNDGAFRLTIE